MAKPFQITLIPGAVAPKTKPGWHKRQLAASRRHKPTTAPQAGDSRADMKAVEYALWLAARDGIEIPAGDAQTRVDWQPTRHGYRPRAVAWYPAAPAHRPAARGMAQTAVEPLLAIELPHWDYDPPAVVETTLLEWAAPVVTETTREPGPVEAGARCPSGGEPDAPASQAAEPQPISAGGEPRDPHPAVAASRPDAPVGIQRPRPSVGIGTLISAGMIERPDAAVIPTRSAAPPTRAPREAIAGPCPPEAIRGVPVPLSWVHPLVTGRAGPPVVLHAAPVL